MYQVFLPHWRTNQYLYYGRQGFTVKDMLHEMNSELNIPPFMEGQRQLPAEKVGEGRKGFIPQDQLPCDQLPRDQLPLDQLPRDHLPCDPLPRDQLLTKSTPI